MHKSTILIVPAILVFLVFAGCAKGAFKAPPGSTGSSNGTLLLNIGDALPDQVLALEFTINTAILTGGTNPVIISTPTRVEFIRNAAKFETVSISNLPAGTYTSLTLNLVSPLASIVDPVSHTVVQVGTTLTSSTAVVSLGSGVTVGSTPVTVNLEMNVGSSFFVSGNVGTLTPVFTVSIANVGATQDDSSGQFDNIKGRVTASSGAGITIQPSNSAQPFAFAINSSTQFRNGTTAVAVGAIATIEGVTQNDGSLLARQVESEAAGSTGSEVEGIVTSITGNPATSFTLVAQSTIAANPANAPVTSSTITATPTATAQFSTQSSTISGALPPFDATTLAVGQRVEVASEVQSPSITAATGDRIKLQEQALGGTIANLGAGGFTLLLPADSFLTTLTGVTSVNVTTTATTQNKFGTLSNGAAVRVRGLLFFGAPGYTLVASRVAP
ncbi:MAG TPA: DUF5666 domain-containing protein [Candidatus Angelobacter sp.]|jgi:hypothetical protein|nr:DUF5666 domain-containing protein [Candidatus Angelobacter sp.]